MNSLPNKKEEILNQEPLSIKKEPEESYFRETIKFALIAIVIVLPIRLFIAQPFIVSGASMEPTFHDGEYLIVDEISYKTIEDPKRGDVIIFKYPYSEGSAKYYIKRIIGLPNETVFIVDGKVFIKSVLNPNGMLLTEPYIGEEQKGNFSVPLDDDEYFVMGDNRAHSSDSRVWGPLEKKFIIGRPILRLLPVTEAGTFPGIESGKN